MLRYRTRDLASLDRRPCPCGRTGVRMSRVVGRSDDMLIIRGVNVFPSQIEEALLRVEGTAPHYLIEVSRPGTLDEAVVKVEIRPGRLLATRCARWWSCATASTARSTPSPACA